MKALSIATIHEETDEMEEDLYDADNDSADISHSQIGEANSSFITPNLDWVNSPRIRDLEHKSN